MPIALQLSNINKTFDGFKALSDAHFSLKWGEVHALLGENGAGKSSLMNIAAGLYAPESGEMRVDDNPVHLAGPRDAQRHQIGMVHQHFKLVQPFTVAQNILLANPAIGTGGFRQRLRALEAEIHAKARELGFDLDPLRRLDSLSVAEQQRVEILKVLLAGARILILDEPTAVLTDREADTLLRNVHALSRTGVAVVLVTHKLTDVKRHADRVTVMRGGETVATVDPQTVSLTELVRLTVGESVALPSVSRTPAGPALLAIRGLRTTQTTGRSALDGVDLEVRAGEIYGLAGVGGNGQGELAAAIMGLLEVGAGEIVLTGTGDMLALSPVRRRELGIASIPADRHSVGLAGELSIADNFGAGQIHDGRFGSIWRMRRRRLDLATRDAVAAFDVQGVRTVRQKAALLSGGNAQKLVIAREFNRQPRLVIAHSPSRGLDIRAGAQVHSRLIAARERGAAVLLISEDLDEILTLSDRIGVMARGRVVAEFAQPANRQSIGQAMVDA